jgi:hypothetical protein
MRHWLIHAGTRTRILGPGIGLMLAAALGAAPPAAAEHVLQAEPKTFEIEGAQELRVEFPVGNFRIEGDDGETIRVSVRIKCKGGIDDECQEEARRVRLDHSVSGGTFVLEFEGIRKNVNHHGVEVEARVLAPRAMALKIEMGVGDLDVRDMGGDLQIELGVGDLDIVADRRDYRSADVETGVGDATIRAHPGAVKERGFIGHSAKWYEGKGRSTLDAHVGVGEARVTLN